MSMATQISLIIKRQNWIKSKINNLVYNKSNKKYYGKLDSIQSCITTKNFFENVIQGSPKISDDSEEFNEEDYYNYEEGDEFGNERYY